MLEFRASAIEGTGAFATQRIPEGTRIIEYLGERISKHEAMLRCEQGNVFIFQVTDTIDLDGSFEWNPARLINHSCEPNAQAEESDERIWIIALRDINPGEEITFNYGYGVEDLEEHPCFCGAPNCLKFMVAEEFASDAERAAARETIASASNKEDAITAQSGREAEVHSR